MAYHPKSVYLDNLTSDLQNSLNNPYLISTNNLVFGDVGTNLYRLYDPVSKKLTTPTQPPFTVSSGSHIVKTSIGLFAWSQGGRYVSLSTDNGVTWNTAKDFGSDLTSYALKVVVVLKNGVETMLLGSADYDLSGTLAWATIETSPVRTTFANPLGGTKACPFRGYDGTPLLVIDGVGGSVGIIAKYNGSSWDQSTAEPTGTISSCMHVVKTQNNNFIATGLTYSGGLQGFIRRSTNFTTWSNRIDIIASGNSAGLYITPTGRIINSTFSSVTSAKLRYSDDDGLTWNSATFPVSACNGSNSFCVPIYDSVTSKLYIASTSNYILSSTDNGTNWITETSLSGVTITAFSSNFLFNLPLLSNISNTTTQTISAALNNYTLLTTTAAISANLQNQIQNNSSNISWYVINDPVQNQNMQNNSGYIHNTSIENFFLLPSSPQTGNVNYLVDNNAGGWALTLNNNQSLQIGNFSITGAWNSWNNPIPNNSLLITNGFVTAKTGLVIGYTGGSSNILKSNDSINWGNINTGIAGFQSLAISDLGDKLIGVTGARVYTSNNSGGSWTPQQLLSISQVACSSGGDVVIGIRNLVGFQVDNWYISTNSGVSFSSKAPYNVYTGLGISKNGNNIVLCSNDNISGGYIHTSSDMGENFTQKGSLKKWKNLAISSDANRIIAIVSNEYIYISDDNGNTWNTTGYIKPWEKVVCSDDGNTIVALTGATADLSGNYLTNSEIYVSQNFGTTWQKLKIRNTVITTIGLTGDGKTIYVSPYNAIYQQAPVFVSSQYIPTTQNISVLTKNDPYRLTGLTNSYADIVWIDSTHAILEEYDNVTIS